MVTTSYLRLKRINVDLNWVFSTFRQTTEFPGNIIRANILLGFQTCHAFATRVCPCLTLWTGVGFKSDDISTMSCVTIDSKCVKICFLHT